MATHTRIPVLLVAIALVAAACTNSSGTDSAPGPTRPGAPATTSAPSAAGTNPAPEFPEGLDWLNVEAPLDLESLRGKVVLLDFWTYGCINCIHIIPDLKRLEAEYPDELVVIGVHSAKFTNEGQTENIRQVIQRYGLEHAVVNDVNFEIWNSWGASAWPTVALIDPAGNAVGSHAGEGVYEVVAPVLANLVAEFGARGELNLEPIELRLEKTRTAETVLSYPGKVLAADDLLYIADTGHHRIIKATEEGQVLEIYGNGEAGLVDGSAAGASFSSPQGLALVDGTLYVADTANHAVRAIDLATGAVTTLAGDGTKGWPPVGGAIDEVPLASPWALAADGPTLYVANAGTHQIWRLDLVAMTAEPLVGSAREGTRNGPLAEAELAQPSGLALDDDGILYFADSESSSIRSADVASANGLTDLVAGAPLTLFDFGDEDGVGPEARFQHPLGVAVHGDRLLVADTYNSKIKTIDLATGSATALYGGEQGWADGAQPRFYEPGGISVRGDTLWVADTNNHVIRRIDLLTGMATTVVLSGLEAFTTRGDQAYAGPLLTLPAVSAGAGPAELVLRVSLPDGYKVNEDASSSLFLSQEGGVASFPAGDRVDLTGANFPFPVAVTLDTGTGRLIGDLTLVWCREDAEGLCFFEQLRYVVPVEVTEHGPSALIELPLVLKEPAF
jgi:sugar lactone lactonase YvrE/thiol-disulfide isomerase/thioredoxin